MQILLYLHSFITRISTEFVYVTTLCSTIVCTNLQTSVSRLTYIGIWDRQSPGTTSLRHEFEASPGKWNKRHVPFVVVNYSWYYRRRLKLVSSVMASCDKKLKKSVSLYEKFFWCIEILEVKLTSVLFTVDIKNWFLRKKRQPYWKKTENHIWEE